MGWGYGTRDGDRGYRMGTCNRGQGRMWAAGRGDMGWGWQPWGGDRGDTGWGTQQGTHGGDDGGDRGRPSPDEEADTERPLLPPVPHGLLVGGSGLRTLVWHRPPHRVPTVCVPPTRVCPPPGRI